MSQIGRCKASPSLALIKYWGKADSSRNLPATPSIALTLKEFYSETTVQLSDKQDSITINGVPIDPQKSLNFFSHLRTVLGTKHFFEAQSSNNFPTAAGLASSSSGYAALTAACVQAMGKKISSQKLSSLARVGSASAARAIYGGFTLLDAGAEYAVPLYDESFWPELRVVVVKIDSAQKKISSRSAMEQTRLTSPYYSAWVDDAPKLLKEAKDALGKKDLEKLGESMRSSYLRMFATMFGAEPPVLYWKPSSLAVIHACERLRNSGTSCWETMDAGPQLKIFCLADDAQKVVDGVLENVPELTSGNFCITSPGSGVAYQ